MATASRSHKGMAVKMTLDLTEFNKVMKDYMTFQKRLPSDVVNAKLFFIARNATMTTKAADKGGIEAELRGPSRDYPDIPLGSIIINSQLKAKGERGLSGDSMGRALDKLIKKRKQSINFVRAGWKNAIKILEAYLRSSGEMKFASRGAPKVDKQTMNKKNAEILGKATPAKRESVGGRSWGEIQNDVHGSGNKMNLARLNEIKLKGLQAAVDREVRSIQSYVEKKLNPVHNTINRNQGL